MTIVTIGGVTIGLCILMYQLVTWWPGQKTLMKDPARQAAKLLPFLLAWTYGCLITLGIGGIIGWTARTALWITNWLGDVALVWGVGGHAGQHTARASYLPLTQTGGAIVLILTVALIAAMKKSRYGQQLKLGTWCGVTLGTSAGVAGFAAAPIAVAVNWVGSTVYGTIA
jgi:hypothetical protein